jgi:pimeloyl-ACP methyl ester carboxylesterase
VLRAVRWLLVVAAALYGTVCLLAFLAQRRLLYFPDRYPEDAALRAAAGRGLSPWRDAGGALIGWRMPAGPAARARALVLHGNAGSALDRLHYASALARRGVEVVLLEYPGYGARPGAPTVAALGAAAAEALDQLAREGPAPIWVLGESLGTGVAGRAVALRPGLVSGLALVTPFARMTDVVGLHYPWLPRLLLRDRYAPEEDLAAWRGPTWLVLAGRDEVVGVHQGLRLADGLRGPRRVQLQEQGTHDGLALGPDEPFWAELVEFLEGGAAQGR